MTARHLLFLLARRSYALGRPVPALFIMGHMRCGSTLLLHLLLTSRRLIACGERNVAYRSTVDLDGLTVAARFAQRAPFRRVRYAVDQINHDALTPKPELLDNERVRLIFLVREPHASIGSIVRLSRDFYDGSWDAARAAAYYRSRIGTLASLKARFPDPDKAIELDFADLISDTTAVLRRLEQFLGLDTRLREDYSLQPFTGRRGDPSQAIRSGRVLRHDPEPAPRLPGNGALRGLRPGDLEGALDAYRAFRSGATPVE